MTNEEFGRTYDEIRPRLLKTLQAYYGMPLHDAEDLVQNMAVKLLEQPDLLATMGRSQVEAWFQRKHAGRGRGLNWRVNAVKASAATDQARDARWAAENQKNSPQGTFQVKIEADESILGREGDTASPIPGRRPLRSPHIFADAMDEHLDMDKEPPAPKPKRKYTRKPQPQAAPATADF